MLFKTAIYFERTDDAPINLASADIANHAFRECGQVAEESIGFVSPITGEAGDTDITNLAYEINGNIMLCVRHDQKIIPTNAVKREVKKRTDKLREATGETLNTKEMRELAETVRAELIKVALVRTSLAYGFIHKPTGLVVVDAGSLKKADAFITLIRRALTSFPAVPTVFSEIMGLVMTRWMTQGYPPGFTPLYSATIRLPDEGVASFKNMDLDDTLVTEHIDNGGQVKHIEVNYRDTLSFCLQDDGVLKKIKFLNLAETEDDESDASIFDADMVINTSALVDLHRDLCVVFSK